MNNRIYLISAHPEPLLKAADDLKQLPFNEAAQMPAILLPHDYKLDITELIPSHIRNSFIYQHKSFGPNCFNTVLYYFKILPFIRHTTNQEFLFYLQDMEYFFKLTQEDQLQPGDVGVIQKSGYTTHAFIYVSDYLILHKVGSEPEHRYEITSLEEIFNSYKNYNITYHRRTDIPVIQHEAFNIMDRFHQTIIQLRQLHQSRDLEVLKTLTETLKEFIKFDNEIEQLDAYNVEAIHKKIILSRWNAVYHDFEFLLTFYSIAGSTEADGRFQGLFCSLCRNKQNKLVLKIYGTQDGGLGKIKLMIDDLDLSTIQVVNNDIS